MNDESDLKNLLARTKEQGRVINELMRSIKRLQLENDDLRRAKLTIREVANISGDTRTLLAVIAVYPTESGVVVEVSG